MLISIEFISRFSLLLCMNFDAHVDSFFFFFLSMHLSLVRRIF